MNIVGPIWNFLQTQAAQGHTPIALRGPRRASKTWTVVQFLLDRMYQDGDEVIFSRKKLKQSKVKTNLRLLSLFLILSI